MAEGPIDFDPATDDSNINEEYDDLQPYEGETQEVWWKRVGPQMRRFSTDLIEKIWKGRKQWDQNREENIPLLEMEEKKDSGVDILKKKFPNAQDDEFFVGVDDFDRVTVKLKKTNSKPYPVIDADGNVINTKLPPTLKDLLGKSVIEKAEDNDARIERNSSDNEQDRAILEDHNASEGDKEAARERIAERERQNEVLEQENEALEERLTLKERVKRIFRKYGVTIVGVVLGAAAIITAIVEALSKRLAQVANGVGNGLKALGKKLAELLPGAIGAIVSFLLKTAGEAIGFLAKNAWLLIVAVVIFLIERVKKSTK